MDIDEKAIIEERKEKVLNFLKRSKNWIFYAILAIITFVNIYIRTLPMKIIPATGKPGLWDITTDNWTLGPDLDPFLFLRQAKYIVLHGSLPAIDTMRYVPIGFDTARETILLPSMIAYFHKMINLIGNFTIEYSAVVFPVVVSIFTTIIFFLFVRKLFESKGRKFSNVVGLLAAAMLVILPSLMARTLAGIPEKESVSFAFMFLALYLFLCAWKAEKIKNSAILGALAGVATACLGLIWGGVVLIYTVLVIIMFACFIFEKIRKKEFIVYSTWLIASYALWLPLTNRIDIHGVITNPSMGSSIILFVILSCYMLLTNTKLGEINILKHPKIEKIPKTIVALAIALIVIFIVSGILLGFDYLFKFFRDLLLSLNPKQGRLILTVAEN